MIDETILDDSSKLTALDPLDMLGKVESLPQMFQEGYRLGSTNTIPAATIKSAKDGLVICGMGGSAVSGDILKNYLWESFDRSILVVRNYALPKSVTGKALVIALSYSGDTEETNAAVKDALKRGCPVIAVTSGGKLALLSEKEKFPSILIPAGLPPRSALGYLLGALLGVVEQVFKIEAIGKDVQETLKELGKIKIENQREVNQRINPAKKLAAKIFDKLPVIFGSDGLNDSAGYRWKTQLNENSKITALSVNFPELNHNEIVNLSVLKRAEHNLCLVLFRDDKDSERNKKRIEITKSLIGIQLGGVNEIIAKGESKLSRLLSLIYFGDFVSVYAAYLRGFDPTPVDVITKLKKELNR